MSSEKRIIRFAPLMYKLGYIDDPADKKAARKKASSFYRRFRYHPKAPKPLSLPDGQLAWWNHEWDEFLEELGHTDHPKANVSPLPEHWRNNPRSNPRADDHPASDQAA